MPYLPYIFHNPAGDLDGDTFLVIWDPDIVSAVRPVDPAPYEAAPERQAGDVGMQQLIRFDV